MSYSQFRCIQLILKFAWLSLRNEHMTTGRINQVTSDFGTLLNHFGTSRHHSLLCHHPLSPLQLRFGRINTIAKFELKTPLRHHSGCKRSACPMQYCQTETTASPKFSISHQVIMLTLASLLLQTPIRTTIHYSVPNYTFTTLLYRNQRCYPCTPMPLESTSQIDFTSQI